MQPVRMVVKYFETQYRNNEILEKRRQVEGQVVASQEGLGIGMDVAW